MAKVSHIGKTMYHLICQTTKATRDISAVVMTVSRMTQTPYAFPSLVV